MDNAQAGSPSGGSFFGRNEFLLRRLHSLSGLVPVGAFMCVHLVTNAAVLDGPRSFQSRVDMIHSLGRALPVVEWVFIFLPLLFHAGMGIVIAREGQVNSGSYPTAANFRYTLQRVTAWIALFFIAYHVFHMHGWIKPLATPIGGAKFDPHHATSTAATALSSLPVQLFYLVGIVSCVFHLANGLWTAGITWGLWTSPAAQARATWGCAAFGVILGAVGLGALGGMISTDVERAQQVENRMEAARRLAEGEDAEAAPHESEESAEPAGDADGETKTAATSVGSAAESAEAQ